jgi:protein-S-isoprenylcysteine O-methyltransferase Ste14
MIGRFMPRFAPVFVWAGGTLFVASLALTAWWYLFVLGRALPFAGWQPLLIDTVLFSMFAAHHSVFARDSVKRSVAMLIPDGLLRSLYVWTASVLLILVCLLWQRVGGELYSAHGVRAVVHVVVQLTGIWMIVQSVRAIDPLELAGIRQPLPAPQRETKEQALQVGGPYRFVRHPLYCGWILAVFGHPHMTADRLAFAAITTFYLVIAIPWEERSLTKSFGEAYRQYTRQVRWRVMPFIY